MLNELTSQQTLPGLSKKVLHISGTGPAGLAAAITCARAGGRVVVHERKQSVGSRSHGDFQGQENWTDPGDVIGKLEAYDQMWRQARGGEMRAGIMNRFLYAKLGKDGYTRFLRHLAEAGDIRQWLVRHHQEQWYTRLLFPWANRALSSKRKKYLCTHPGCTCTWCRCGKAGTNI